MLALFKTAIHYIYDEELLPFNRENIPNYITVLGAWLSRLGLYLFGVYFLLFWINADASTAGWWVRGFGITCLALGAVCDGIDGFVARRLGLVSKFGELYDPHVDKVQYMTKLKALVIDAVVAALMGYSLAFPLQVFLIAYFSHERDLASMFHRAWAIREAPNVKVSAGSSGKLRTAVCFPGILLMHLIMIPGNLVWLGWTFTILIVGVTIYSNHDYVHRYRVAIKKARSTNS